MLRPHQAADGALVRIRIPGGRTTGAVLEALGRTAERHGSGVLQLTSRAGLQVRGLPDPLPAAFVADVTAAGLLPSADHERVRNVLASPLTGLAGGRADLGPLLAALDARLSVEPGLVELSGRFVIGLDDGRGDIAALQPDLTYRAHDPDSGWLLVGSDRGRRVAAADAVAALVALALDFAVARQPSRAWRVRDLPAWVEAQPDLGPVPATEPEPMPLGAVGPHASVQVPLGFLPPGQRRVVTEVAGDRAVVVTPWRGLVLEQGASRLPELVAAGLVAEPTSPWTALSACVGAPWCGQGRVDTQSLVAAAAALGGAWPRTHVSGCERRCGAPTGPYEDLVAPSRAELLAVRRELVTHG
ncbi:MAG: Precorrin-3B synthase [Friedmanniella sp.]|nr:Precorrin-3B synthase [Friedmanniella sp.]